MAEDITLEPKFGTKLSFENPKKWSPEFIELLSECFDLESTSNVKKLLDLPIISRKIPLFYFDIALEIVSMITSKS